MIKECKKEGIDLSSLFLHPSTAGRQGKRAMHISMRRAIGTLGFCSSLLISVASLADDTGTNSIADQINALPWVHGPATLRIGEEAQINLPTGMKYLDNTNSNTFLKLNGNPPSENEYVVSPENISWFAVYEYDRSGHVDDSEKIDPETLFKNIKDGEQESNDDRKKLGMSSLYLDRWSVAPHYDRTSHNLEWGTEMHDDSGEKIINYLSRILGRDGMTRAVLVSNPENLQRDLVDFRSSTSGFSYLPTKSYENFTQGDKVAAYGIGALVAGGAAAAVVKTGLFAGILAILAKLGLVFFKVVVLGGIAAVVGGFKWIRNLFHKS